MELCDYFDRVAGAIVTKTFASLFSCAGGADQGAKQAGLQHLWGVEKEDKWAAIARLNNFNVITADLLRFNWDGCDRPDFLSASPPCQNASVANPNAGETELDIQLSMVVAGAIHRFKPDVFTLENVRAYAGFKAYALIKDALLECGYAIASSVLNAADYGVPQTRHRLFLVAKLGGNPVIPNPTHSSDSRQLDFLHRPHVGWAEGLSQCNLPSEGQLNPRMLRMLPSGAFDQQLVTGFQNTAVDRGLTFRARSHPSPTLTASMNRPSLQPWIASRDVTGDDASVRAYVLDTEHMASLQSFPADFKWGSNPTSAKGAIGNAVPRIVEANF
jgi:DNA (cytosine-5)-methyltransferase 1